MVEAELTLRLPTPPTAPCLQRDFKDAEIYIIRFQQCLTRSMTLIKMYFVSVIRKLTAEVADKMAGKELSETASNALLYAKFSNQAASLRILLSELEKRARQEPREYGSLLQECFSAWFTSRASLLAGPLAEEVRRMDPGSTDLIKLVSQSVAGLHSSLRGLTIPLCFPGSCGLQPPPLDLAHRVGAVQRAVHDRRGRGVSLPRVPL